MEKVSTEIRNYIESQILPKYAKLGGHTGDHIEQVIERSMRFAKQAPGVDVNMVYAIAAYHDLGRLVDDETHNIESAKMMRADSFLKEHFSAEDLETMAQAVEDHRASLGREPRSIYGKLVSSADRNTSIEDILSRSFDYAKHLHPDFTEDEIIEEARVHVRDKYSPDGYAAKTMFFDDPDFKALLVKTEKITRTSEGYAEIVREHNKRRWSERNTNTR